MGPMIGAVGLGLVTGPGVLPHAASTIMKIGSAATLTPWRSVLTWTK